MSCLILLVVGKSKLIMQSGLSYALILSAKQLLVDALSQKTKVVNLSFADRTEEFAIRILTVTILFRHGANIPVPCQFGRALSVPSFSVWK